MPALHENLRKQLEKVIIDARDTAEAAAQAALQRLAVDNPEPFKHHTPDQRELRNQLRARARQLGDLLEQKKQAISHLTHELAYEHWHRMLFARFLAENGLLIHPDLGVPVTLAECEDLAKEEAAATKTKPDTWALAGRFASKMLPQIFRVDDALLQITLAPEDQQALEKLLVSLPGGDHGVFTADDSLGWVYQFWQTNEKERVNKTGDKITGDTLSAVTQLFTEHYMVLFLLHNTVGAWHARKVLTANPKLALSAASEDELRKAVALDGYTFDYLRFVRTGDGKGPWRPAAGSFDGWPKIAAKLTVLDPCCGSGHFLVAGFDLLVRLRMHEESLSAADAADAVLRDNIHGLELDLRCTQIAAFNLAIAAWRFSGYRPLPPLNIACTGIAPRTSVERWLKLTDKVPLRDRGPIRLGLKALHDTFTDAATLGSLIDPNRVSMVGAADYETLAPVLLEALDFESSDDARADAVTAQGLLRAAELLVGPKRGYTLVVTNVPYLGQNRQNDVLKSWASEHEQDAKADIATMFISRAATWLFPQGTVAVVSPQNWLFLTTYRKLRERLLREYSWDCVARLGSGAFETIGGAVVNVALIVLSRTHCPDEGYMLGLDVADAPIPASKANSLRTTGDIRILPQVGQRANPDARITFEAATRTSLLEKYADSYWGIGSGDIPRFMRKHWEVRVKYPWKLLHNTFYSTSEYDGRDEVIWFLSSDDVSRLSEAELTLRESNRWTRGSEAWGTNGIAIHLMSGLSATLYTGEVFQNGVAAICPKDTADLSAIWCFCSSPRFTELVRQIDQKLSVTNLTLLKVPFDLAEWTEISRQKYPGGLPEPESNDPTQWVFHGWPETTEQPLQVAVSRLLGYRWPAEFDTEIRLSGRAQALVKRCDELLPLVDDDGIACVPSVRGEEKAAERVLSMLTACGLKAERDLDDYLRNEFFEEHYKLFHHRPFIWHIWDGRKQDGFHALVNYHNLADGKKGKKLLETLTYVYLGEWINRQKADVKAEKAGAEARLVAALELQKKLEAIAVGEPPFDIFVRWKPLYQQPIGWEPDINDGVRMNIRPFVEAGILRKTPNVKWTKDRGKDPETAPWFKVFKGERINDHHLTNAEKTAGREAHEAKEAKAASGRKR